MSPVDALIFGIRSVLLESDLLNLVPISSDELSAADDLPAALISVHADVPDFTLGPTEAWRYMKISVEWIADGAGGVAADAITDKLNEAARSKLFLDDDDETAADRLNRFMGPEGYNVQIPMEVGSILPYSKRLGKDKTEIRRARGYFFEFRTERI